MRQFLHGGDVWREGDPSKWIDFSANINPKGPPKIMIDALKEDLDKIIYYPDQHMGMPVKNLASYLHVPEGQVIPTSGGIGALSLIGEEIRPRRVIILQPGFVEYLRIAQNIDAEIIHVPIINEDREISYPIKQIISELQEGTMLFICNPSNPIGSVMPKEDLELIVQAAQEKKATVVVDEAFIEFAQEESVKDLVSKYSSLIIAGSLTKIFAIPGVRLGYICANERIVDSLKVRQTPWTLSSFACSITNVLDQTQDYIEESLYENKCQRDFLSEGLKKLGIKVFPSRANYLFIDLKRKNITLKELQEKLYTHKILLRDCSNYIYLDEYYGRIAVKDNKDNSYLLSTLERYL